MTGEVVLSAALRNNLLSLQRTQSSIDKVQNVLATGLKVSSALDNPQNFFASQSLKDRSSDLSRLLDGIGQSIQTIKAADAGVTSLTKLVEQADSLVASAREAVTAGGKEASVTGTIDLSSTTNIASLAGVDDGDTLVFEVRDTEGNLVDLNGGAGGTAGTVTLSTDDSIEQVIAKINDIGGGDEIHAELTSAGYLKITALNGNDLNIVFNGDGSDNEATVNDLSLATALGFGIAKVTNNNASAANSQFQQVAITALANTKLVSGVFYDNGATSGFADASDLLTTVEDTDGGGNARFVASAGGATALTFTVNDSITSSAIAITGRSIQGLVDAINTDSNIGDLVRASYDSATGKLSIEAIDATVQTININLDADADENTAEADFDFGAKQLVVSESGAQIGETFTLGTAASILAQYENDFNTVLSQIDELVEDSGYRGINLLAGDELDTFFNEDRSNKLTTSGQDLSSAGLGLNQADFSRLDTIETAATEVLAGLTTLRNFGGTLANSLSIIQTRENFTKSLVETLNEGSDKLTVADQNEEGAKLLALQTRQQLGITALSLAAQAQQSVLRLF